MRITFNINSEQFYENAMPNHFVTELADLADPFDISSSLVNLDILAFIKITEGGLINKDYESIKTHPYVVSRENLFKTFGREFDVEVNKYYIMISDYGKQFAEVCLEETL